MVSFYSRDVYFLLFYILARIFSLVTRVHKDCEKRFGIDADHSHSYACPECRGPREFEVPNELAAADMREHALETCPKPGYDHMIPPSKVDREDDMDICSTSTESEQGRLLSFNIPHMIPSPLSLA